MMEASIASSALAVCIAMLFCRARVCRKDDGGVHMDLVSMSLYKSWE
jgi:hypothetical protein